MIWSDEFVELSKATHDRASFDCGEVELNTFIKTHAAKHMEAGVSTTMILHGAEPLPSDKHPICAFYTIAPSSIRRETLPESEKKRLPFYPVPVFLLAQMAIHSDCQGQGLGKVTLIKALEHLWSISYHMRAYAVIVDRLNKNAEEFYSQYGFEALLSNEDRVRMFLPMKTVAMLFE